MKEKNIPLVFKYMSINQYLYQLLINNELHLSPPQAFNDPDDSRIVWVIKGTEEEWLDFLKRKHEVISKGKKQEEIDCIISSQMDLIKRFKVNELKEFFIDGNSSLIDDETCLIDNVVNDYYRKGELGEEFFANSSKGSVKDHKDFIDMMRPYTSEEIITYKITCFSKENKNTLMWAHYAENHTGVCLAFKYGINRLNHMMLEGDKNSLVRNEEEKRARDNKLIEITYDDVSSRNINIVRDRKIVWKVSDLAFTKSTNWAYEKEYRLIDHETFFKFNPEILTQIIFGLRCTLKNKESIKKVINFKYEQLGLRKPEFLKVVYKENNAEFEIVPDV